MRRVGSELGGALGGDQSLEVLKCGDHHLVVTRVVQVGGGGDEKGVVCLLLLLLLFSFLFCSARYLSGGTGKGSGVHGWLV